MHRENHSSDSSRGVSGIGAKPAISNLSKQTEVQIFTRKLNGTYYKVLIPWDKIHSIGKYTGMIEISEMSYEEKTVYSHEILGRIQGTTIQFKYNKDLKDVILNNFKEISESNLTNPLDRIGCIFGRDNIIFRCDCDGEIKEITLYNYFDNVPFYTDSSTDEIIHWYSEENEDDRFTWGELEIIPHCGGLSKEPKKSITNFKTYTQVGTYTVKCGMRIDLNVFHRKDPLKNKTVSDLDVSYVKNGQYNTYDIKHIGDNSEFLGSIKLVRNNQLIGLIPVPDTKLSSARASAKEFTKGFHIQCDLLFNPVSEQMNRQDTVLSIQENKNQFDGKSCPLKLTRLVKAIKEKKFMEVWDYFQRVGKAFESLVPALPVLPVVPDLPALPVLPVVPDVPVKPIVPDVPVEPVVPVLPVLPVEPEPLPDSDSESEEYDNSETFIHILENFEMLLDNFSKMPIHPTIKKFYKVIKVMKEEFEDMREEFEDIID